MIDTKVLLAKNRLGMFAVSEPVYAMANVFSSRELGMTIQVNPDPVHIGLAYFKLYDHYSYLKATKIARISMEYPRYIFHKGQDGKDNWFLTNKEKRTLIKALENNSKFRVVGYGSITVWQAIILFYNSEKLGVEHALTMECTQQNKDAFVKKYANEYDHLDTILPIDLPMPNYLLLK